MYLSQCSVIGISEKFNSLGFSRVGTLCACSICKCIIIWYAVVFMSNSNTHLFHAPPPPPPQGFWGGSNPGASVGFQISVTDYPAISSFCLFDFLHRLKPIPYQTSFIDETTQPPAPWINTMRPVVYRCRCRWQRLQSILEKVFAFHHEWAHCCGFPSETCRGIISDSTSKGMWLDAILFAMPSFTYNIYSIDFLWLKIWALLVSLLLWEMSCGLIFQSLVIHSWQAAAVTGGGKRRVFTGHMKKEQQPCCCFHVCVCRTWREGVVEQEEKC